MRKIVAVVLIVLLINSLTACGVNDIKDQVANITQQDEPHVLSVKNGHPNSYPDKTYGEYFEKFFGSPTWKYYIGTREDDENKYDTVEFTGYCTYMDVEVKALIQFTLNDNDDTFEVNYLSFNDVPQNMLTLSALLSKVFEDDLSESSVVQEEQLDQEETLSLDEEKIDEEPEDLNDSNNVADESDPPIETPYAPSDTSYPTTYLYSYVGEYEGFGGYTISFSAYSDGYTDAVGCVDIYYDGDYVGREEVYECYDRGGWADYDYEYFFVIPDSSDYELSSFIGFNTVDGQRVMEYNSYYREIDFLIMTTDYSESS